MAPQLMVGGHDYKQDLAQSPDFNVAKTIRTPIRKTDPRSKGCVYILTIADRDHVGLTKIGCTGRRDIDKRFAELDRLCKIVRVTNFPIHRIREFRKAERLTQSLLAKWRQPHGQCRTCQGLHDGLQTECFKVSPEVAIEALELSVQFLRSEPYGEEGKLHEDVNDALDDIVKNFLGFEGDETPMDTLNRWRPWIDERIDRKSNSLPSEQHDPVYPISEPSYFEGQRQGTTVSYPTLRPITASRLAPLSSDEKDDSDSNKIVLSFADEAVHAGNRTVDVEMEATSFEDPRTVDQDDWQAPEYTVVDSHEAGIRLEAQDTNFATALTSQFQDIASSERQTNENPMVLIREALVAHWIDHMMRFCTLLFGTLLVTLPVVMFVLSHMFAAASRLALHALRIGAGYAPCKDNSRSVTSVVRGSILAQP